MRFAFGSPNRCASAAHGVELDGLTSVSSVTAVLNHNEVTRVARNVEATTGHWASLAMQSASKLADRVVTISVEYAIRFDFVDDADPSWPTLLLLARAILRPREPSQKSTFSG